MSSNDLKLIGKVVLVTGASQGLGFEIARRFVAEGASVVICARSSTDLQGAKTELLTNLHKDQQILYVPIRTFHLKQDRNFQLHFENAQIYQRSWLTC